MTTGITVANLHLKYGRVSALENLSLSLEGEKIYGLLGRNGSGKSSLLAVLAAFRKATAGEVRVAGQPVFENPAIASRIALIREGGDTVDAATKAGGALRYAARYRPNWDAPYAARLVERFRIPLRSTIGDLSRGQRAALGIVLGLASRAPITMFDETYLGMDVPSRHAFYDELLRDYMENPRTFIISTHMIAELEPIVEEILILDRGRLLLHEAAGVLRARGAAITGPAETVDRYTDAITVIGGKRLGRLKSAFVYGDLDEGYRQRASAAGLEIAPLALQDLFVHLTEPGGVAL